MSRSRQVTVWLVRVSLSIVKQKGQPASSTAGVALTDGLLGVGLDRARARELGAEESFSATSGMPSLFTSGKTAALMGAMRGWNFMNSGLWRVVLGVRLADEREDTAVKPRGGLDAVRQVPLAAA